MRNLHISWHFEDLTTKILSNTKIFLLFILLSLLFILVFPLFSKPKSKVQETSNKNFNSVLNFPNACILQILCWTMSSPPQKPTPTFERFPHIVVKISVMISRLPAYTTGRWLVSVCSAKSAGSLDCIPSHYTQGRLFKPHLKGKPKHLLML